MIKHKNSLILLLVLVFYLVSGLSASYINDKKPSSAFDDVFKDGRNHFYQELRLFFASHPYKFSLLPGSVDRIQNAEEEIPFLYENLVNIMYVKEIPHFRSLMEKGDEESVERFRQHYLNLCREAAHSFIKSFFIEQKDTQKLLNEPINLGKSRLELILESFGYEGCLKSEDKMELPSLPEKYDFQWQWGFEVANFHKAHQITRGKGKTIAIIDSGIRPGHELIKSANINHDYDFCLFGRKEAPWSQEKIEMTDQSGHGTVMVAIISAYAPEAEIRVYKIWDPGISPYPFWPATQVSQAIHKAVIDGADIIIIRSNFTHNFDFLMDACQFARDENVIVIVPNCSHYLGNPEKPSHFPAHYTSTVTVAGVVPDASKKPVAWDETSPSHYTSVAAPVHFGPELFTDNSWAAGAAGGLMALITSQMPEDVKRDSGKYYQWTYEILIRSCDPKALGFKNFSPKIGYGLINAEMAAGQVLKTSIDKLMKMEEVFKKRLEQIDKERKEKKKKESEKK